MISLWRGGRRFLASAGALASVAWAFSGSPAMAFGDGRGCDGIGLWGEYGYGPHSGESCGIAYGKPFYGGYGMVYGYPKHRKGGDPFYGRDSMVRWGIPYPGNVTSGVTYGAFGEFTGAPPIAPLSSIEAAAAAAAARKDSDDANLPSSSDALPVDPSLPDMPADPTGLKPPSALRAFGIEDEPIVDASGVRGMKVTRVTPGTPAAEAGLHVGDVVLSINGYFTEEPGNFAWIVANAAPEGKLSLTVRPRSDLNEQVVSARVPSSSSVRR